jgi:hypothetical protein
LNHSCGPHGHKDTRRGAPCKHLALAITVSFGITLTRRITDFQLRSHGRLFQEGVRITGKDDAAVYARFSSNNPRSISPCVYGSRVFLIAEKKLKFRSFLNIAIQLSGKTIAVADNHDALRTHRSYKEPFPHEVSCKTIREQSGTHFDPWQADAFLHRQQESERVSRELAD